MNADEARLRGLGAARGCMYSLLIMAAAGIVVYVIGRLAGWW